MSCHKLGGKELKVDNKTRRKRIAQGVRAMLWGERRERQSAERKRPAGRVKGRERDWGSAWYSKLTHSHGTQAPIRVRATLIKPDLQPLAAGWVNVCGSLDVCVFRIVDVCVNANTSINCVSVTLCLPFHNLLNHVCFHLGFYFSMCKNILTEFYLDERQAGISSETQRVFHEGEIPSLLIFLTVV